MVKSKHEKWVAYQRMVQDEMPSDEKIGYYIDMFQDHRVAIFMRNYGIYEITYDALLELFRVICKVGNYAFGVAFQNYEEDINERLF